jgi:hypothetical protein
MAKSKPKREPNWLDEYGITNQNQRLFLTALSVTGNPTRASLASKVSRKSHYAWLAVEGDDGDKYRDATEDAKLRACEFLEGVAHDRAVDGVQVAKWHNGKRVGYDTVRSDLLLIFLMKGAMPDKYRDNMSVKAEVGGKLTLEQICSAAMKPPSASDAAPATDSAKSA